MAHRASLAPQNPRLRRELWPSPSFQETVLEDADGDGLQDVGEPGLANVTVELYNPGLDGMPGGGDDILIASTLIDADGGYLFDHLSAGDYFVDVNGTTLPTGLATSPGTTDPAVVCRARDFWLSLPSRRHQSARLEGRGFYEVHDLPWKGLAGRVARDRGAERLGSTV